MRKCARPQARGRTGRPRRCGRTSRAAGRPGPRRARRPQDRPRGRSRRQVRARTQRRGWPPRRQADADAGAGWRRRAAAQPCRDEAQAGTRPAKGDGLRPEGREAGARRAAAGNHRRAGTGQPDGRTCRRRGQEPHEDGHDGHGEPGHRRRHGRTADRGIRPPRRSCHRRRRRTGDRHRHRPGRGPAAASAGGDDHGPRRPRQDIAAGCDPQGQRRRGRGRRDHAAHRRLPGDNRQRPGADVPRHAGPRGLHQRCAPVVRR
jgi:hypothetical protein